MNVSFPSIYDYNDFRKFIADFQESAHRRDPSFTKSRMTKLLGLPNSRSFLSDVLRGKRISSSFVERFIKIFGFRGEEANYFRTLVRFNQCDNPEERELCFEQLVALNRTPKKIVDKKLFAYYKDWYNAALRALLNVYDFDGEKFQALGKMLIPAVPVPKIKQAFRLLIKMGMVVRNENGFFKPTDSSISVEDYARDEFLRQFQIKCLALADYAIVNDTGRPKVLAVNTVSVSMNGLKRIERQIERFRSQVRSIVHKDEGKPEKVYQIDVLFFPVSR